MSTFKNKKNFERFLCEIDAMTQYQIESIMGVENYIDTPGFYKEEKREYEGIQDFMLSNMGTEEFNKLKLYWETNVKTAVKS